MRGTLWPTDPAHDLKTSLGELMADLQRATAASYSPRSFAPPPRQVNKRTAIKYRQIPFDAHHGEGRMPTVIQSRDPFGNCMPSRR